MYLPLLHPGPFERLPPPLPPPFAAAATAVLEAVGAAELVTPVAAAAAERLYVCVVAQVDAETRLMSDSTARACISVRLNAKIHNSRTSQHPISLFHAPPIDHETPSNTSWGRHMP